MRLVKARKAGSLTREGEAVLNNLAAPERSKTEAQRRKTQELLQQVRDLGGSPKENAEA